MLVLFSTTKYKSFKVVLTTIFLSAPLIKKVGAK